MTTLLTPTRDPNYMLEEGPFLVSAVVQFNTSGCHCKQYTEEVERYHMIIHVMSCYNKHYVMIQAWCNHYQYRQ